METLNDNEYIDKLLKLKSDGALSQALSRQWLAGIVFVIGSLAMGIYCLVKYLGMEEASLSNMHFLIGIAVSLFCSPAIILIGMIIGKLMEGLATNEGRPYTLLLKYYNKLVENDIDPFTEDNS